jgi:hypothetical protein
MRRLAALAAIAAVALASSATAAPPQDSARASGTYQFIDRPYGLGTVSLSAKGSPSKASGRVRIRVPRHPEVEWRDMGGRVTCVKAVGNVAVITGRVTRIHEDFEDELRYFRVVAQDGSDGISAGMNPTPSDCASDRCLAGGCHVSPLVEGEGVVVRDAARARAAE